MSREDAYGITTAPMAPISGSNDEKLTPQDEKKDSVGLATSRSRVNPVHHPTLNDAHHSVGLAVIEQKSTIPQTGERKTTTKWEYWLYIIYCELSWCRKGITG
jgi:hypothetical protein